ncbi:low molecular weight protein-tyrosine-phosphatase [Arcanobacterium hippocoleae]
MSMPYRILIVCTGNICRSPMGEIVLREKLSQAKITDVAVASAAVSAEEQGNQIDTRAARVLREAGYCVPNHRAHQVTRKELQEFDLILAMTAGHARRLRTMMLTDLTKLHLWREFDGTCEYAVHGVFGAGGILSSPSEQNQKRSRYADFTVSDGAYDVPDPWYGGQAGFYDTLAIIERGAEGICEFINSKQRDTQ